MNGIRVHNKTHFLCRGPKRKKEGGGGFSHNNTHIYKISETPQKGMKLPNPKKKQNPTAKKKLGTRAAAPLMKLPELKKTRSTARKNWRW
jgi:hypothetical protein